MIKTVVFDMDGVLFDTEYLILQVWKKVAEKEAISDIEKVLRDCIGRSYEDTRLIFHKFYGDDFDFEGFRTKADQICNKEIEEKGLPIKPGVKEILAYLKQAGYKIGLASSTRREGVLSHLRRTGLEGYFEVVVGGDMVKQSKPNPEIYELACSLLGVKPEEAYCIEDSLNGIRAGNSAGLKVIMVPDLIEPTEEILPLLHMKCESLLEVKAYLEKCSSSGL